MGGKDSSFEVVYRGETREWIKPGTFVFFQRLKEHGGGYWLGEVFDDCFVFAIERPLSLHEGMVYLLTIKSVREQGDVFQDDLDDFFLM